MDPQLGRLYALAEQRMEQGDTRAAIELWRQVLSIDPDEAGAHAQLALCLLDTKRLHAAELEAGLALAQDPGNPGGHAAMGAVLLSRRQFKGAREQLQAAVAADPSFTGGLHLLSRLELLEGRATQAQDLIQRALSIDPEDPDVLVELGRLHLSEGRFAQAASKAQEALTARPEHQDALILAGRVHLRRGDVDEARDHARWALRIDPTDRDALAFLAELKAHESKLLGVWWRFQAGMQRLGEIGQVSVLLAAFFLYRLATILLGEAGHADQARLVSYAWLGVCAYTWFAPALFERMIDKELEEVRLKPDF